MTRVLDRVASKDRVWNAFYKGWFAGRAGRPYPPVDSMVEHSFMVDGYDLGRRSTGRPSHAAALAAQAVPDGAFGGAGDPAGEHVREDAAPGTGDATDANDSANEASADEAAADGA